MLSHDFLYKISHPITYETKGFLLGTCHYFDSHYKLNDKIKNIFTKSKSLVVESHLDNHQFEIVGRILTSSKLIRCVGMFGSISIKSFPGVEKKLYELAEKDSKPIIELETVEFQLKIFEKLAEPLLKLEQDSDKFSILVDKIKNQQTETFKAYRGGVKENLTEVLSSHFMYTDQNLLEEVLYDRNRKMALKINDLLVNGSMPLIAVGAAHLYKRKKGEDGLIFLLRSKGWHITPVLHVTDIGYLHPHHPKTLEKVIAQDWCVSEYIERLLERNAIVTAYTILAASKSPHLIKILPNLVEKLQISYQPNYSLLTLLKGIGPHFEYLLDDLVDKYPDIPFIFISVAIKNHFSEKFIFKLINKCSRMKVRLKDVERAFEGPFSDTLTFKLLDYQEKNETKINQDK